jgi:Fur family iron response transcriptional regulator
MTDTARRPYQHTTNAGPRPEKDVAAQSTAQLLREAGLRPTRQRLALGALLFEGPDRHVTAELLHAEATSAGQRVSLATVYNTLHQFKRAGLLRELAIDGSRAYFDTNVSNHNHFFVEGVGTLHDIPGDAIRVDGLPQPPEGMAISHIDVVVRLVRKKD